MLKLVLKLGVIRRVIGPGQKFSKPKGVKEKADNGNPGGRRLTVLDIPNTEGSVMPQPDEILSAKQKDGTKLKAAEIYERVWK